ncbi:MAG: hypothetical protein GY842_15165, partial [bacterium]|nr:hypothetical protein [bacterium]
MTPSIPLKASSPIAVTLALAFLTLSTLPPAAAQADYALRQIVATGGHQVQGVDDGVILTQEYAEDCRLADDASEPDDRPIAATVSTAVALDVSVMSCLRDPAEPAVHCSWRIRGPESAEPAKSKESWTGWEGSIPIEVPDKTGVYTLSLTCEIQGSERPETVERTLFVTHDTPQQLLHETAPEIEWYSKACTWGRGFGSGTDKEAELLRTLLNGIYRYGQQNWKYGYLEKDQDGGYKFNDHQVLDADQVQEVGLVCSGSSDDWCKCPWTALVMDDSPCYVGDCYIFADVFQNMAATLGIGGVTEYIITGVIEGSGEKGQGFSTPDKSKSLDPRFPSNIICKPPCPSYVFTTHSVRQRD